jgi:hypothetical protein
MPVPGMPPVTIAEISASDKCSNLELLAMLGPVLPPRPSNPWQAAHVDAKVLWPEGDGRWKSSSQRSCCGLCEYAT